MLYIINSRRTETTATKIVTKNFTTIISKSPLSTIYTLTQRKEIILYCFKRKRWHFFSSPYFKRTLYFRHHYSTINLKVVASFNKLLSL